MKADYTSKTVRARIGLQINDGAQNVLHDGTLISYARTPSTNPDSTTGIDHNINNVELIELLFQALKPVIDRTFKGYYEDGEPEQADYFQDWLVDYFDWATSGASDVA